MASEDKLFWEEDQTWSFPILESDENGSKKLDFEEEEKVATNAEKMPPPPPPSEGNKKRRAAAMEVGGGGGGGDEGGDGGESDHEVHIWTERERRKKMRSMFASLHALLPNLPPKADKSSIVDEAVTHIKKLQQTLETLQKQKLESLHGISSKSIINYNFSTNTQQKIIEIPSREAFLADLGSKTNSSTNPDPLFPYPPTFKTWTSPNVVLGVSGRDAHISVCCLKKPRLLAGICFVMEKYQLEVVSAQVSADRNRCMCTIHAHANGGSDMLSMAFPAEEIYKQVAAEIIMWVNS